MSTCSDVILKAVKEAGYGPLRQRLIQFRLSLPGNAKQVEQFILEEAAIRGVDMPKEGAEAINWDALLKFIQGLLPLILQIISLFM